LEIEQVSTSETTIRFLRGPLAERTISIQKLVTSLGRDRKNDIVILDPGVSRDHACIFWRDGSWIIKNLSQNSYITINKQRIQEGILHHNSVVELGRDITFIFVVRNSIAQPSSLPVEVPMTSLALPQMPILSTEKISLDALPLDALPLDESVAPQVEDNIPTLTVSSNSYSKRQVHPLNLEVLNIGRDASNDIIIADPIISALHAQIIRDGTDLIFIHPHPARSKTLNGIWYQGQHIRGDQVFRKKLVNGDIFRIGDEYGTLVTLIYNDGSEISMETFPQMRPIPLSGERLTLGRTPDNTIVLNHSQVSSHHAVLKKVKEGYRVIDTNSTNHVYVNGELIKSRLLHTSDELRIGPYRLTYTGTELREYNESSHIRIDALHLNKVGNNYVVLLHDISLVIPPHSFVALVGGSGAGKSTLLDALNGLRPAQKGTVLYNNVDYYHECAAFSAQLGYVPQDDIVHRDLIVERALYYAARLRLPSDFTKEQIQWRIDEVLEDVEMTDCRKQLISKLSGGQRKRVSIALELLANPGIFFLDEPTSGLDPGLDRKMMMLLRHLADRGRTIILVTHATNNINACDYVCFLAQGGRLVYYGPPDEAKTYFEKVDFAEIYSTLEPTKEQPDIPIQAEKRFLASPDYQRYVALPLRERKDVHDEKERKINVKIVLELIKKHLQLRTSWSQFILLSIRYLELLKNDVGNLLVILLQAPVIAIMLMLMVRFEVGAGVFDANQLVQCRTQILTPSGPLALPQAKLMESIDCQHVLTFLREDPYGRSFAQMHGGLQQALQAFLLPGPGTNAQKVLFIMAFATVLFGCINGAREIVKEAAIYNHERAVNLAILPYMFSKIVVLGMLCLFQSAVLTLIIELGEPLHQGIFLSPILETYITLSLTSLAGLMIGLTISAIAPTNDRAISMVPIILIPQVIFSGAIIPLKDWLTQILAVVFPTRWAMVALGSSIGLHADKIGGDHLFGNDDTYHSTLYSIYSRTEAMHRLIFSWAALAALIFILTIAISLFLKRKDIR
jgi:ABC transport system ATP-binding/permease protein